VRPPRRQTWLRALAVATVLATPLVARAGSAAAQGFTPESTPRYDVGVAIEPSGDLLVTETIQQDFGSTERHGIFRNIPDVLHFDDTYDRVYPIDLVSVRTSPGTPDDVETKHEGGDLVIRIGDPDRAVTGEHTYTITYRVRGAMNGFPDHDELYWNAIGTDWEQRIGTATVRVEGPAGIAQVACFTGPAGSSLTCEKAQVKDGAAVFSERDFGPNAGLTVVVALPSGSVKRTGPILVERWSLDRAFARTPGTVGGSIGLLALAVGGISALLWKRGRDRRYVGSQVDQVMGSSSGTEQTVPLFESDEAPVEFAPPDDLRPGQVGTLIDERANTLDVTATIVDLAVRRYVVIEEIAKHGWFGKPDWKLVKQPAPGDELLTYERTLVDRLFETGDEVLVSELRAKFASKLHEVEQALYADALRRKWFLRRPDRVRTVWFGIGAAAMVLGVGATIALARWSHLGLLGIPLVLGGLMLTVSARWMPRRTAKGTAMTRRINGFRRVIETAETNMSRWAEQENVFTRYLPYAIVFGCTDKWAGAFAALATPPPTDTSWYVSTQPFAFAAFADQMDGFAVTTSGIIASTPAGSGGSGFGGGFSGGGGGGGGGGSW
jgi:uncharacterized protein (TIGR04222 family)